MKLGDLTLNSPPEQLAKLNNLEPKYDYSPFEKIKDYTHLFSKPSANAVMDILNAYIVSLGLRPGFIPNSSPQRLTSKLILQYFPDLKILPNILLPHAPLIVKKDNPSPSPTTHDEIGTLLGYPCGDQWNQISNMSKPAIGYQLIVYYNTDFALKSGIMRDNHHLFGNTCVDESKEVDMYDLAKRIKNALFEVPGMDEFLDDIVVVKRRRRIKPKTGGGKRRQTKRLRR